MTTRTFIGANNTSYAVAADWSPGDAYPDNGDTAVMNGVSVNIPGANLQLTNVTWNLTNATVTGSGTNGGVNPAFRTITAFTANLSGTNTFSPYAYFFGTTVFNQAPSGMTYLNNMLAYAGTMSITGGTFELDGELRSVSQLTLNTTMVSKQTSGQYIGFLAPTNGGKIEFAGGSYNVEISILGGAVSIDSGVSVSGTIAGLGVYNGFYNSALIFKDQNYGSFTYDGATLIIGPYSFADADGVPPVLTHVGNDTVLSPVCFLAGTRVLTVRGPLDVQDLSIGDLVATKSGIFRPIRWIGRRAYPRRLVRVNRQLQPVMFEAGSLGGGLPERDLSVSSDHAMYIAGYLVRAFELLNGTSIHRWVPETEVRYFHIELDSHDIIFAEGAATETFLDDESRHIFHNEAEFHALYPDARPAGRFCAPHLTSGFELERIRTRLAPPRHPALAA